VIVIVIYLAAFRFAPSDSVPLALGGALGGLLATQPAWATRAARNAGTHLMSRPPGHGRPGHRDYKADTEAEATATATAIAGLRWRLSHHGTLGFKPAPIGGTTGSERFLSPANLSTSAKSLDPIRSGCNT
jgi:hypothetical protein